MVKVSQAAAVVAAASLPVVAFASSASAGVTVSRLAVSQGSSTVTSMSIDASKGPVQVSVTLDSHCFAAYGNGQTYGIAAVSGNPSVVTVSPASVSGLHCGDAKTFTLTGVGYGSTAVTFDPVAAAPGLQKKLGNVVVPVTVTGAGFTVSVPFLRTKK